MLHNRKNNRKCYPQNNFMPINYYLLYDHLSTCTNILFSISISIQASNIDPYRSISSRMLEVQLGDTPSGGLLIRTESICLSRNHG